MEQDTLVQLNHRTSVMTDQRQHSCSRRRNYHCRNVAYGIRGMAEDKKQLVYQPASLSVY